MTESGTGQQAQQVVTGKSFGTQLIELFSERQKLRRQLEAKQAENQGLLQKVQSLLEQNQEKESILLKMGAYINAQDDLIAALSQKVADDYGRRRDLENTSDSLAGQLEEANLRVATAQKGGR